MLAYRWAAAPIDTLDFWLYLSISVGVDLTRIGSPYVRNVQLCYNVPAGALVDAILKLRRWKKPGA